MKVIVDTSVWSTALRRNAQGSLASVEKLQDLIRSRRVQMIGPIRQEILSGIRSESQFKRLREHLEGFPDHPLVTEDYVTAAQFFSQCRAKGIQGSNTDFLICAVSFRN